ncbi:MAG TPA: translocation/assembly module TamB domain-containing protein, partial [Rhodanobacteraceae bacterium]|nr:translocation/assembly module TamB domain-containing protein [Rhodanobacteraceae bacterium]
NANGGKLVGKLAVNDRAVLLDPAQFRIAGKTLTLDPLRLRSPQVAGVATATGTLRLDADPVSAALDVKWRDVLLPADLAGQELATRGELHFDGSAEQYSLGGSLSIGPPDRPADLQLKLQGTPRQIALQTLALVQKNGGLDAHGTIGLQPQLSWKLDATARKFDPGALLAGWDGALDFALSSNGGFTRRGPQATLKLGRVAGTLRGRSVTGSEADLRITPDNLFDGTLLLVSGRSRVRAQGQGGDRTNATIAIDVASLSDWLPQASGAVQGNFTVRGAWPKLAVAGELHGAHLSEGTQQVDTLRLTASIPDTSEPGGDFDVALGGVHASGLDFDAVRLDARGTAAAHRLQIDARGSQLNAALALQGSWNGKSKNWSGTLHDLHFTPQGLPEWRQQQPAALSWKDGAASLSQLCLSAGEPDLCVAADRKPDGTLATRYRLQRLPMQLLATLAAGTEPLRAGGELSGSGQLALRADGSIEGNATLQASKGSIAFASTPNNTLLAWTGLNIDATANGQSQHIRLHGNLSDGGSINGDAALAGAQHALSGQVSADLRSLAFLEAFSTEIANVRGTLGGTLALGGTLSAPRFQGSIRTQDFAVELPRTGLKLHDGRFAIQGDALGTLEIDGQIASGKGVLHVAGNTGMSAGAPLALEIRGDDVLVADLPAAHVVASPNLRIGRTQNLYTLTGTLGIPNARIEAEKLPGQGPAKASPDVVVVDETQQQAAVGEMPMRADITVKLGDNVSVKGYGLDGKVHGALAVHAEPEQPAIGRGEIRVDGTYQAYGQNLQIQQGRLLFAGTRLDNPGLDIRATRNIRSEDITVGLSVRGTAQQPILTVFSDPSMEQAQALSYLVTGRSLESLKSGEADTLNTAAQALGGLAGDRLVKSVGSRLGVEAGVAS